MPILLGFVCQYSVLPLLAVAISKLMHLPAAFATGLILLGCCPGERELPHLCCCDRLRWKHRLTQPHLCSSLPLALHSHTAVPCPAGGQASNVATFVAHGDVALSVLMTAGKRTHLLELPCSTSCTYSDGLARGIVIVHTPMHPT